MIIDGKKEAEVLREEIKKEIISIKNKTNKTPTLTVILIGDFVPSQIYVKNKEKSSKEVGINSNVIKYSKDVSEEEILKKINELNNDKNVSGILVQLPLPNQISKEKTNDKQLMEVKNELGRLATTISEQENNRSNKLKNLDFNQQEKIDKILIELDGSENKNNLGANDEC